MDLRRETFVSCLAMSNSSKSPVRIVDPDAVRRPSHVVRQLFLGSDTFFTGHSQVRDLMSRDLACLRTDDTIAEASQLLRTEGIHHIPVVVGGGPSDSGHGPGLAGLVSQRDLARAVGTHRATQEGDREAAAREQLALRSPLSRWMTRDVIATNPETDLAEAVSLMLERKVDCLPVVSPNHAGALCGIITTTDIVMAFLRMEFLRRARPVAGPNGGIERLIDALMGRVDDVMTSTLHTIGAAEPVSRAVAIIQRHRVRHVPVLDGQRQLMGVITDRDVAALLPIPSPSEPAALPRRGEFRARLFRISAGDPQTTSALQAPAGNVMTRCPVVVAPGTPLVALAEHFSDRWLDFVPVVDPRSNTLVGLVTQTDFLHGIVTLRRLIEGGPPQRDVA